MLLIASDTIGPVMAGSGIRYWNLARVLGERQPVTLATPAPVNLTPPTGVAIVPYGDPGGDRDAEGRRLARLVAGHDIVIAQHLPYLHLDLDTLAARHLVVDLYAPWILEKIEYARVDPERGEQNRADDVEILNRLLSLGDFFLCASERQRDFWLGALAAAGRLDLGYARHDPDLRGLLDIVPFGLPEETPLKRGPGPRERFEEIGAADPVLLWNGGIWNWMDPLLAIRAMSLVIRSHPNARLVFMGTRSPGAQVAEMRVTESAHRLASELGLLDRHVFFNDWVPYQERQNWLLESALTVTLNTRTIESRFAFRTRVLDNLWCGVPVIATEGDVLADLIRDEGIGVTVPPGDTEAVAAAVDHLLRREESRQVRGRIAAVARRYTWEQAAEPLVRYCRAPWRLRVSGDGDAQARYLSKLERLYTETAAYAQNLERAIAEKDAVLLRQQEARRTLADRVRRKRG